MKPDLEIKVRPFRNWHIASCNSVKATGTTRTEAIAHLLLSLRNEVEVVEIRGFLMSRSSLEGSSIGADRALEPADAGDQGLGDREAARGGAEPVGALGIAELGVCAGERRDADREGVVERGEDRELGCAVEVVGRRDPAEIPGIRCEAPGHVRGFLGRRASASRCR